MILKSDRFIQIEDNFYFFTIMDSIPEGFSSLEILKNSSPYLSAVTDVPGYGDFYSPFNKVDFSEYPEPFKSRMENCKNIIVPHLPILKKDVNITNNNLLKYLRV